MSSFIFKFAVTTHSHHKSCSSVTQDILQTSIILLSFFTQGYKTNLKFFASEAFQNAKVSLKHEEEKCLLVMLS